MEIVLKFLAAITCSVVLSACVNTVPNDGPLLSSVVAEEEKEDGFVYALVNLNGNSVSALEDHNYYPLSKHFGLPHASHGTRIGVGDVLNVTIFEAGPDGIFSTAERKSVSLTLTVQEDGRISIPFAGAVRAKGKTPEQVRSSIISRLKGKAVEPDVIVNITEVRSRSVVVNGAVNSAKTIQLITGKERLLDVIGAAGGPSEVPYDTYVSVSRGSNTQTALLQTLITNSRENINVQPADSIFLTHDPRTFMAFGAVTNKGRFPFKSGKLSLIEAAGIAGGIDSKRANPSGYFVFRYEHEHVVKHLAENHSLDLETVQSLVDSADNRDKQGRLPVVYQVDLNDPDNFFVAKRFDVRAGDVIYVSRQPVVDFAKFLAIVRDVAVTGVRAGGGL